MKTQQHFVFDFDDTLMHFTSAFCDFVQRDILGLEHDEIDWLSKYGKDYDLMTPFRMFKKTSDANAMDLLHQFDESGKIAGLVSTAIAKVYKRAVEDRNTIVTILTARAWMRNPTEVTVATLCANNLPQPDNIVIIPSWESKADHVAALKGPVAGVIDDSPAVLSGLMRKNPKDAVIYTADRPWNKHLVTHMRIPVV